MLGVTHRDMCLLSVLVSEYEHHRLPRLFHLWDKVEKGTALGDDEYDYLFRSIDGALVEMPLTVLHPELEEFFHHVYHLYRDICTRALELEQNLHH